MYYQVLKSFCKPETSLLILHFALFPLAELFLGVIVITRWVAIYQMLVTTLKFFAVTLTDCWDFSRWKSHQEKNAWVVWSPTETILSFKYSRIITQTVICWKNDMKLSEFSLWLWLLSFVNRKCDSQSFHVPNTSSNDKKLVERLRK